MCVTNLGDLLLTNMSDNAVILSYNCKSIHFQVTFFKFLRQRRALTHAKMSASKYILLLLILMICISSVVSWWTRRRRRRSCSRVDCQVNPWSSWSACSQVQCGKWGTRQRTRTVQVPPLCGGTPCPSLQEGESCQGTLRVDCKLSSWSKWSACSQPCGGSQTSSRYVVTNEQCGGTPCSTTLTKRQPCRLTQCLNQGTLINKKCSCSSGYYGSCCQYSGKWKLIKIEFG